MKKKELFLHCAAVAAAMLSFAACSGDGMMPETIIVPETETPVVKGHPLTITASIGTAPTTRMTSAEGENCIKLTWEANDQIYMLTSKTDDTWEETYYTFKATEVKDNQATFVCDNFTFPEGTTKVKFVYTSNTLTSKSDLDKTKQSLGEQTGLIADVAKKLYMETEALDAASEDDVKKLTATLNHANAVMKVVIPKNDIEWGDNSYAPKELTMKLQSNTLKLEGTTDNTITVKNNEAAWGDGDELVANVVVCMTGTKAEGDRWIFTTKDGLDNSLTRATSSAKALEGGKRYKAPVTFQTDDYFPLLDGYVFVQNGSNFVESKKQFRFNPYNIAGWKYDTALNLSKYKYLVIDATELPTQLRIFDDADQFNAGYQYQISTSDVLKKHTVIDLESMAGKYDQGTGDRTNNIDRSKLAYITFWSYGEENGINLDDPANDLKLTRIYVTNTKPEEESNPSVTVSDIADSEEDAFGG